MNKPHETHPTRENLEARIKELEGEQHTSFQQENDKVLVTMARHKTPRSNAASGKPVQFHYDTYVVPWSVAAELERQLAAANKRAGEARAVAIEEAAKVCKQHGDGTRYTYQREEFTECESKIRALSTLPPSHMVIPLMATQEQWDDIAKAMLAARNK